jgi:hypothetical protein
MEHLKSGAEVQQCFLKMNASPSFNPGVESGVYAFSVGAVFKHLPITISLLLLLKCK